MKINENKFYKFFLPGFFIILALPLLALPPLFFPPEWGKAIVFKVIFSAILALFLWQTAKSSDFFEQLKQKYISQKKLLRLLLAVLAVGFLSLIFSSDILFSLWGSPHRSGGFVFFSFCILFSIALFLTAEEKDWKKLWDFSFIVGDIVMAFALVQHFNIFPNIFAAFGRPVSTLSNTILLAIYLLFLTFSILPFVIKEKSKKRYFYIFSLLLFIFGIIVTSSRATWIGLAAGAFYFLFFYPVRNLQISNGVHPIKKSGKLPILKIIIVAAIILATFTVYYLNANSQLPGFLEKIQTLKGIQSRVSIKLLLAEPRFSAWQVAFQAIREKPIFGWGPENQSIGFDKYYDPSLPYITKEWGSWWDRAHNIFLDLALQYGILFLAIYLFFFGCLFWQLHKTKHSTKDEIKQITTHATQTVFLAYFVTVFFGFDSVSTYILLFFIIGYSLHLTVSNGTQDRAQNSIKQKINSSKWKKPIIALLFILFFIFLWKHNLKPLMINAEINKAKDLACEKKLPALKKIFSQKSFLDAFLRLTYAQDIKTCAENNPLKTIEYIKDGVNALNGASGIRPFYTRTWLMLGSFNTILFANETDPQIKKNLYEKINSDFSKALALGPKHQETLSEWAKFYFAAGEYEKMKNLTEKCVALNSDTNTCYWYLGLSEILLGDEKKGEEHIRIAKEKRFSYNQSAYSQLALVYTITENYEKLIPVYESLISLNPQNIQYYANLAVIYKEMGDYKNAQKTALKIIEIDVGEKEGVDEFIKTLRR